jgi:hypothetical protein
VGITMAASPLAAATSYECMPIKKIEITVGKGKLAKEDPTIAPRLKIKEDLPFSQADFDEDLKMLAKEFDSIEPRIEAKRDELVIRLIRGRKSKSLPSLRTHSKHKLFRRFLMMNSRSIF